MTLAITDLAVFRRYGDVCARARARVYLNAYITAHYKLRDLTADSPLSLAVFFYREALRNFDEPLDALRTSKKLHFFISVAKCFFFVLSLFRQ